VTLYPVTVFQVIDGQLDRWLRTTATPTPTLTAPGAVSGVSASSATSTSALLSWGPPANTGGSPITGYTVSRTGGTPTTVLPTVRSQTFGGLTASTSYTLSVAAVNAIGTGPASTRTVTTPSVIVTGARFPGDPNPLVNGGRLYLGASQQDNNPARHENATGVKLGVRHRFWSNVSDLATPNGPIARAAVEDHAQNRLPLLSWHVPGANWAGGANGAYDSQIDAWIDWCEQQAKPIFWVVNHEPDNGDGIAANYRAWMQHIRSRIAVWEAANGPRKRLVFLMCLTAYAFAGGNGGTAAWWPGDGVVDVVGVDIYADHNGQTYTPGDSLENANWNKFVAFVQSKRMPFFVCEFNWLPTHPTAAAQFQTFYDHMTSGSYDCIGMSIFDSGWWVLSDNNGLLSKFHTLMQASDSIHMSTLGY
jgi:hypothetical protein